MACRRTKTSAIVIIMNKSIFIFFACMLYAASVCAQARVKGSGIVYTNGAPTHAVSVNTDAEIVIDTSSGKVFFYVRGVGWQDAGYFVRRIAGASPPSYTPADKQSILVINEADSMYHYRLGQWRHINRWVSDGNKGDITVSASGNTWTINNNAVSDAKIRQSSGLSVIGRASNTTGNVADIVAGADGHVLRRSGATLGFGMVSTSGIADGAVTAAKINQSGASVGEILKWNGTSWAVSEDDGASAFTQLSDVPSSYSGHANKLVAVNASANGLTFVSPPTGAPTFVYKTADEVVNNSTTPQDDDHLVFICSANKKCFVEYHLFITNANTSEIKFEVSASGSNVVRAGGTGSVFDFSYTINQDSGPIRTYETNGASSEHGFMRISAFIDPGSSNRTVVLKWAQQNATPKNTTVQSGSWLNYVQVD